MRPASWWMKRKLKNSNCKRSSQDVVASRAYWLRVGDQSWANSHVKQKLKKRRGNVVAIDRRKQEKGSEIKKVKCKARREASREYSTPQREGRNRISSSRGKEWMATSTTPSSMVWRPSSSNHVVHTVLHNCPHGSAPASLPLVQPMLLIFRNTSHDRGSSHYGSVLSQFSLPSK